MNKLDHLQDYLYGRTIFSRLFWSFVGTSISIILIATLLYYNDASQNTEQQMRKDLEVSLQQSIAIFEKGYLTPIEGALKMMEMSPSLNNFLKTHDEQATLLRFDIEKQFVKLIDTYPEIYSSVRFVDNFGRESVVVEEKKRIRDYSSLLNKPQQKPSLQQLTTLFRKIETGEPRQIHFSPVFISAQGHSHFYAGIALLEPDISGFGGAIIFECDLGEFIQEMESFNYRDHPIASLLTAAGDELTASHFPNEDVIIEHNFFPKNSPSNQPFITLHIRIPVEILNAQKSAILNSALLMALLAITATFIVAWLISRQIIQPITELVHASKRLSNGDFTPVSIAEDRSEIGQLSQAFNVMMLKLKTSTHSRDMELQTRISTEMALQRSHEELQSILNSTSEGIYGINHDGNCTFCNRAALEMLCYKKEDDLIGNNAHTLFHYKHANGSHYPQSECPVNQALQHGEGAHRVSEHFWRADGSKFPVEYRSQPLKRNGQVIGAVVTFSDITEIHIAEETLRRTQKMDALGKLTGGIAHDFNNMLGVILGFGELLEATLTDNPKQTKYIQAINTAGERARKLTAKLLTFSRKQDSIDELVNINQLLLDEQHILEKTLTAQIILKLDLEPELWNIWLDKSALEDAILNMSINAMHAMPSGGHMTIRTRNLHIAATDTQLLELSAGDYVQLSLTDTGIGMDSETRQKVFDPFFTTKGDSGTGLGMSQLYGFVKQAGGGVSLYSEPGDGTQINVFFPHHLTSQEELLADHSIDTDLLPSGNETILVVDDEPALCAMTSEILSNHGYRVLTAIGGKEALTILQHETVALMLSDVIMPNMNGYELANYVAKNYPQIKIQMATGFSDNYHADSVDEDLHRNRLQKPYTSKLLLQKIRELLDH
jgi:PAS domain S-box-containing protein